MGQGEQLLGRIKQAQTAELASCKELEKIASDPLLRQAFMLEAVVWERPDVLQWLKRKGVDLNERIETEFLTPFELAASLGKGVGFLRQLSALGCKASAQALVCAAERNSAGALSYCLLLGCDCAQPAELGGQSALQAAKLAGMKEMVDMMEAWQETKQLAGPAARAPAKPPGGRRAPG